jgi:hypothetical protein
LEKIRSKENDAKEVIEQEFGKTDGFKGTVEDSWENVKG